MGWLLVSVIIQWTVLLLGVWVTRSPPARLAPAEPRSTTVVSALPLTPSQNVEASGAAAAPRLEPTIQPPAPAPLATFRAGVRLGDHWFVLHRVEPRKPPRRRTIVEAILLTQGQVVLVASQGDPIYPRYTLVNGQSSCGTRSLRRVAIELDTGDPAPDSALGPRWLADQVSACEFPARAGIPFVAIAGDHPVRITQANTALPQRVMPAARRTRSCRLGRYEPELFFDVEAAQYTLLRAADDPEAVVVRRAGGSAPCSVLETRTSLYWDDTGLDC